MKTYRGRFAPSPTGPLHFGSLFAATISYLHAKAHQGIWLVRIEDLDPLRESPQARASILETLQAHALVSDESIVFQSDRSPYYEHCLNKIRHKGLSFNCPCSRQQLLHANGQHSAACKTQRFSGPSATRFKSKDLTFGWHDIFAHTQLLDIKEDVVLKRKEGLYAYQLAVVCDDIDQNISHVIRGSDLLTSTPMQLALYQALDRQPPCFGHFPVITDKSGQKLSKQSFAPAIDNQAAQKNLLQIFALLNLNIPDKDCAPIELLQQATAHWHDRHIPKGAQLKRPEL